MRGGIIVAVSFRKRLAKFLEAGQLPAIEVSIGTHHCKGFVHFSKDESEDARGCHDNLAQLDERVGIVNVDVLLLNYEEVVSTARVLYYVGVADLDTFHFAKSVMQNMVHLDLVDEGCCELVARWVHRNRNQRSSLIADRHVFEHEEFSRQFALPCHVVPETDCGIFF